MDWPTAACFISLPLAYSISAVANALASKWSNDAAVRAAEAQAGGSGGGYSGGSVDAVGFHTLTGEDEEDYDE